MYWNILLAEDDPDDILFFQTALQELQVSANLSIVKNGEELMTFLVKDSQIPDILFLDLIMPRKNGFQCLAEIAANEKLKDLSVVVLSTFFPSDKHYESDMIENLVKIRAHIFFIKPGDPEKLKEGISFALATSAKKSEARRVEQLR